MKKPYIKPEAHIITRESASPKELAIVKALENMNKDTP